MYVVAVASGDVAATAEGLQQLRDEAAAADLVIAVDGGLGHLVALGVRPDLIVGDLDSAAPDQVATAEAAGTEVLRFPAEKDETDLELALVVAARRGATTVNVLGVFGGRVDHELANIGLLAARRWRDAGMRIRSDDGNRSLWIVHDQVELDLEPGTTLSLVPWGGDAIGVSSSGVRWPLGDATLPAGSPRGVSNVAVDTHQQVSVDRGVLLVVVDRTVA